ncbi:hypothetical protein QYM36_015327 [Artemia franciscana]|nr:hypothetical protein QYM36_015327 [Artemia franciscana]
MSPKETAVCPPMKSPSCPPPSLAQATSLIAKASLQRTIINRMKTEPREEVCDIKIKVEEKLTPEDEARRLKRRERNKVAATKCREKKKEKTKLLIDEAEVLECQNMTLKAEIQQWEEEKHRLKDVLRTHSSTCSWSKSKRFYYSPYPPTPVYTPTQPPTPAESFGCSFNPEVYQDYSQQSFGGFYNSNQFVPEQPTPIRTPDQPAIQFESSHFNIQQIMSNLYNDGMS